eukprot:4288392-Pleurochrysis_carterae.AAC.2
MRAALRESEIAAAAVAASPSRRQWRQHAPLLNDEGGAFVQYQADPQADSALDGGGCGGLGTMGSPPTPVRKAHEVRPTSSSTRVHG